MNDLILHYVILVGGLTLVGIILYILATRREKKV